MENFVKHCINRGGKLYPLLIDSQFTNGTGLTNPSILVHNDKVLINLRHVEYTLYHAEKQKFCHPWGPLVYLHKENDLRLITNNYLCELDNNYSIKTYSKIDTSTLDIAPLWEFVGLEDIRLVSWETKLYASGVRRDTTANGQGRIELSELIYDNHWKEITRTRIPAPGKNDSYCEKNWMPIVDMPYHFVKWCNPTEVVRFDLNNSFCETIFLGSAYRQDHDFRGGSNVITWKNKYRIAIVHQVDLYKNYNNRKNGKYRHRFILWDMDWNIIKYSDCFDFLGAEIEFSCGMDIHNNQFLITFGYQDNSAFLVTCPADLIEEVLNVK